MLWYVGHDEGIQHLKLRSCFFDRYGQRFGLASHYMDGCPVELKLRVNPGLRSISWFSQAGDDYRGTEPPLCHTDRSVLD